MELDGTIAGCEIPGWDEKIPGGGNQDNGDWLSVGGYGPWNELGDPFLRPQTNEVNKSNMLYLRVTC